MPISFVLLPEGKKKDLGGAVSKTAGSPAESSNHLQIERVSDQASPSSPARPQNMLANKQKAKQVAERPISATSFSVDEGANATPGATGEAPLSSPRSMFDNPTVRHAGRAHIRGKFRRVWRPRYLELLDSGLVRYYELPPMANVALPEDSDWEHVNMMPKDTLWIYHARIIDVTTLRDIHVGLPRGSHGFMFRGRPVAPGLHYTLSTVPVSASIFPAKDHLDSFVTATTPSPDDDSETMDRHHRRQDTPEMPTSASLMACHPPEAVQPRDFFCAVNTLEEAQTWVVVLQWAASMCRKHHYQNSSAYLESFPSTQSLLSTSGHGVHPNRLALSKPSRGDTLTQRGNTASLPLSPGPSDVISVLSTATNSVVRKSRRSKQGKIVVTKVPNYRLIRTSYFRWEIAYEVNLLLLPQQKTKIRNRSSAGRLSVQDDQIEERCILMTPHDLESLLARLVLEFTGRDESAPKQFETQLTVIRRASKIVSKLPRLQPSLTSSSPAQMSVKSSLELVNSLLRSIVTEAILVNSRAVKHCFVLESISNADHQHAERQDTSIIPRFLRPMLSPLYHSPQTLVSRNHLTPPTSVNAEEYVKKWLSGGLNGVANSAFIWWDNSMVWCGLRLLQRPFVPEVVATTFSAGALFSIGLHHYTAKPVTMRLDFLALSWLAAASLGRYMPPFERSGNVRPPDTAKDSNLAHVRNQARNTKGALTDETGEMFGESGNEPEGDEVGEEVAINNQSSSTGLTDDTTLSSPLPKHPDNNRESCWSIPPDNIFRVRGPTYLDDKVKVPSGRSPFECRGVDVWLTDNPERHIARLPNVLGGKLGETDTFLVNFLLPFGNLVAYFAVPPLSQFPPKLADVWTAFVKGDQQYRDARFKFLPIVMEGPWIVKAAVGNGTSPALLSKVIPLQYFFREPGPSKQQKGVYEVDVIITASSIAKGILSVVRGHTKSLSIAFSFIIEAAEREELPETVLGSFQLHALHLEQCPQLPDQPE